MADGTVITDLADLAAPLSAAAFADLMRRRLPSHYAQAGQRGGLLDWDGLIAAIRSGACPAPMVRLYKHQQKVPDLFYRKGDALDADAIDAMLASGASLIANDIDRFVPAIGRLCATIAAQTGENVTAVAVATAGAGGALKLHYDNYDLAVIQVDGAKRWLIHDRPAIDPIQGRAAEPPPADAAPLLDVVLQPGDRLFVPAGYRHRCDTRADRSLHLGIMFYPLTAPRVLDLMMREMGDAAADRRPLRCTADDDARTEAALKQRLIDRIAGLSLGELRRRHGATRVSPLPKR